MSSLSATVFTFRKFSLPERALDEISLPTVQLDLKDAAVPEVECGIESSCAPSTDPRPLKAAPRIKNVSDGSQSTPAPVRPVAKVSKRAVSEKKNAPPPQLETISRTEIQPSKRWERIRDLSTRKRETKDSDTRAEINAKLRCMRDEKPAFVLPRDRDFCDLAGHQIGKVRCTTGSNLENETVIGPSIFLRSVSFDFVQTQRERLAPGGVLVRPVAIRFTALLTEDGVRALRYYLTERLQQRFEYVNHKGRVARPSAKEIRKRFFENERATFNLNVEGIHAHFALWGKVEVFSPVQDRALTFLDLEHADEASLKSLIGSYARHSRFKGWVSCTSPALNEQVEEGFRTLATVISHALQAL